MTTQPISSVPADVADFVTQVRASLADLPADDVDELTAGLAADLSDARAESPQAWREGVGSPQAYAAELRAAAGLPPAGPAVHPDDPSPLAHALAFWRDSPLNPVARRWYDELRPGGWVARGLVAAFVVFGFVAGARSLIVMAVLSAPFVLASVWVGLEARRGRPWARALGAFGAILAVFLGLALAANGRFGSPEYAGGASTYASEDLMNGGEQVTELYGFDGQGQRVDGLRVFDQAGRPLKVYTREGLQTDTFPWRSWEQTFSPQDPYEEAPAWTPPMTLPPVDAASTSTVTSTSTSDPTSSTSESSSSSSSSGTSKKKATESPSPRSTSTK